MIGKTLKTLTFATFGGAFVLLACSDEATEKYPSSDAFCTAKAEEECTAAAPVCAASIDVCKNQRAGACRDAAGAAIAQGRQYRPQAAEKCINDTKALYATRVVDLAKEKEVADTCERVFTGSKKANDACGMPFECEGSLICSRGACAPEVAVAANAPCNNPGDTCPTGTYCGPRGESNFCIAKNGLNDICDVNTPCLETLRCVNRCQEKLGSGEPCDSGDDCSTGFCSPEKKCGAKLVPGAGGCADFGGT